MSLRDICAAIAETPIADITARNLDELTLQVRADDCPIRLLLPSTSGDSAFVGIGATGRTIWTIRDLCLWQPIIEGTGIEQCGNDMMAYMELYVTAFRALRNPTAGSALTSFVVQMGPVPWANGDFWAVDATLTVEEYDP